MAFNFNWSPLIADTERVRDMLTNALNKSPKPPIIVDDIIVNELNLGTTPPELEILEIGDLAEDRFHGIFKMSYTGDAYLTLKTRVQANPLNTYLSTKPAFASPQPLAASSSLTIPIQITLSDIRLSGFVILVFSKQKGITIVFRNDPLESLKVSSTFDSIPFVRNYLQKTIENQLRVLFVEDLPAIIHRLSLRMFSQEQRKSEDQEQSQSEADKAVDPFQNPSQRVEGEEIDSSNLDSSSEVHASFSQKNLLRLAALIESQRTLSLFTPSIRDTVYRAWAVPTSREDANNGIQAHGPRPVLLSRLQSGLTTPGALSSAASQASDTPSYATRPSLVSMGSSASTIQSFGGGAHRSRPGKKRKNRVVNLRRNREDKDHSDTVSVASSYDDTVSRSGSGSAESSSMARRFLDADALRSPALSVLREGEISTPPRSPPKKVGFERDNNSEGGGSRAWLTTPKSTQRAPTAATSAPDLDPTPRPALGSMHDQTQHGINQLPRMRSFPSRSPSPELRRSSADLPRTSSELRLHNLVSAFGENSGGGGGILEQAWMMKMATEIARKVAEEKAKPGQWRPSSEDGVSEGADAPPAYVS